MAGASQPREHRNQTQRHQPPSQADLLFEESGVDTGTEPDAPDDPPKHRMRDRGHEVIVLHILDIWLAGSNPHAYDDILKFYASPLGRIMEVLLGAALLAVAAAWWARSSPSISGGAKRQGTRKCWTK